MRGRRGSARSPWVYAGALASAADVLAKASLGGRREVAFAGRSNAGKSSLLNRLVGQKLARTSKTPGRTQMLHLFEHGQRLRVVDMPGYGFSKTAPATRDGWDALMMTFFESRAEAAAVGDASVLQTFVLVDCRRGLLDMDMHMLDLLASFGLERTVVLTKADKLHRKQLDAVVHGTAMALASTGHLEIRAEEILAAENGAEGYRYDSNGREASGEGGGLILTSTKTNLGVGQLRARVMAPA